jgi:hypothetical protein
MTAMMSGIVLVSAFGLAALACLALSVALYRVTGRGPGPARRAETGQAEQ